MPNRTLKAQMNIAHATCRSEPCRQSPGNCASSHPAPTACKGQPLTRTPLAVCALLTLLLITLPFISAKAAPLAEKFARSATETAADLGQMPLDHSPFSQLLESVIELDDTGLNRVNYKKLKNNPAPLAAYIEKLAAINVTKLSASEQFAYWANLYNALTLKVVAEAYPVKTIRDIDISPGLFANGPWGKKLIIIEGDMLSLDDIEHEILRKAFKDPRVHYAVNCASIGCPNLRKAAFTGPELERQLNDAARDYVNSRRGVKVENGRLAISKIYSWFQEDFGGSEQAVLAHLEKYAGEETRQKLKKLGEIDDYFYDWTLNDQAR